MTGPAVTTGQQPPPPQPGALAVRLKRARLAVGLTGRQINDQLGWHQNKVSKIENGWHIPTPGQVRAWATVCNLPTAETGGLVALAEGEARARQPVRWERGPMLAYLDRVLQRRVGLAEAAEVIGIDRRTLYRWRDRGLTDREADETAVRLGTVPALIWGTDAWCNPALAADDRALRLRLAGRGLNSRSAPSRPAVQATYRQGGDAA